MSMVKSLIPRTSLLPLVLVGLACFAIVGFGRGSATHPRGDSRDDWQRGSADQKAPSALPRSDYDEWLTEDVGYVITKEERKTFALLTTNEERNQFIESFWQRRNPIPDSVMNEFKNEHYRRIAYANEHFGTSVPGWKSDRGHVYILFGHPDEIEAHHEPGREQNPPEDGARDAYPWERWTYRFLESMGTDVHIEFADKNGSGEYPLAWDSSLKNTLFRTDEFAPDDPTLPPGARRRTPDGGVIELFIGPASPPPQVKFMDLDEIVTARIVRHQIQFALHTDYLRITNFTDLVPISIEVPAEQLKLQNLGGNRSAHLRVLIRISTLTSRTIETVEDSISQETSPLDGSERSTRFIHFEHTVPLRPGAYQIAAVVEDTVSGAIGVTTIEFEVPQFPEGELRASTLILGEPTEPQPSFDRRVGPFQLTPRGAIPRASREFSSGEQLGIYLQLYNLMVDDRTNHPNISIDYRITKDGKPFLEQPEFPDPASLAGEQLTLRHSFSLSAFPPGHYQVMVDVNDGVANRRISRAADFTIARISSAH